MSVVLLFDLGIRCGLTASLGLAGLYVTVAVGSHHILRAHIIRESFTKAMSSYGQGIFTIPGDFSYITWGSVFGRAMPASITHLLIHMYASIARSCYIHSFGHIHSSLSSCMCPSIKRHVQDWDKDMNKWLVQRLSYAKTVIAAKSVKIFQSSQDPYPPLQSWTFSLL